MLTTVVLRAVVNCLQEAFARHDQENEEHREGARSHLNADWVVSIVSLRAIQSIIAGEVTAKNRSEPRSLQAARYLSSTGNKASRASKSGI